MTRETRLATNEDLDQVQRFFDDHLRKDWFAPRELIADCVNQRRHRTYLTFQDGELVALAIISTRTDRLINLLVHPKHRGKGLGSLLVTLLKPRLVRAKLNMANGDPRPFYRRLGYEDTPNRNVSGSTQDMVFRDAPPDAHGQAWLPFGPR